MIVSADLNTQNEKHEFLLPTRVMASYGVSLLENLTTRKPGSVLYRRPDLASVWNGKGAWVLLDFGKEIQGGARMIICKAKEMATFRLTFGESVSEAMSTIGEKNATNDHSPRDFKVIAGKMSDNSFGQTGFRFLRVELLSDVEVKIQNIFAESVTATFSQEAVFETDDPLLNQIIETAAYTLRLCFQKGYIWDGIKRDRLIWCGDLHPEILTALYWFGDVPQIPSSLNLLREFNPLDNPVDEWINNIPSYSAWWVVNVCEYCRITGNTTFWEENREYGRRILEKMLACVTPDGGVSFEGDRPLNYFLDWSTQGNDESRLGVGALFVLAAKKWLLMEENEICRRLIKALSPCLTAPSETKPVRAFQVLAGRETPDDARLLAKGASAGFSTFMAYYILKALAKRGEKDPVSIAKEYYGGMLSRGATTFWEDFDLEWLKDSGRIDEFPLEGEKDLHGDFGKHCYEGFRHSLCHGWSSGVLSFFIEYILGLQIENDGKTVTFTPNPGKLSRIQARFPLKEGFLNLSLENGEWKIDAPVGVEVRTFF